MRKLVVFVLASLVGFSLLAGKVCAQEHISAITWNILQPVESFSEFIDKTSYRGFAIEGRKFYGRRLTFGMSFAINVFDEQTTETLEIDNGAVTGKQFRWVNAFPILATSHVHLGRDGYTRPYFGVGAGAYYIKSRLEIGVEQINENQWHFGVAPEVGILFPIGYGSEFIIGGKLNYAFPTSGRDEVAWVAIFLGFSSSR